MPILDDNGLILPKDYNFVNDYQSVSPISTHPLIASLESERKNIERVSGKYRDLESNKLEKYKDRQSYVVNYLMKTHGLDKTHSAALTGVWFAESKLNPGVHSKIDSGSGIAQWTGNRIKTFDNFYKELFGLDSPGVTKTSLEDQIDVAIAEYKARPNNWNHFLRSRGINAATDSVLRGFENGSINDLATVDSINKIYTKVWDKKGIKYSGTPYEQMYKDRLKYAKQSLVA